MSSAIDEKLVSQNTKEKEPWEKRYLYGVQGLRTVAALLVATYHIWFHRVSGGVDVFFVVAGFFAARSLMRLANAESFRALLHQVGKYWARTARRVVPSAMLVVLATVAMSVLWMPETLWESNVSHGFASALFYENWHLITTSSDYAQMGTSVSPFQQFWALSIQVQSYLVVPLLIVVGILFAKLLRKSPGPFIVGVLALCAVASFAYSVWYTSVDQAASYFSLTARLWEFLAGSLFFFAMTRWRGGARFARVIGWVALVVIVLYGAVLDLSRLLPGYHSIVLVSATCALIFSSVHESEPGILTSKAVLGFADASFTFYLWHWPILIFYRWYYGDDVGLIPGIGILALSALLAYATTRWFERPIRFAKKLQSSGFATAVACVLLMVPVLAALSWWSISSTRVAGVSADNAQTRSGAEESLLTTEEDASTRAESEWGFYPSPEQARTEWLTAHFNPPNGEECVVPMKEDGLIHCTWVEGSADKRVVVFGSSHEYQWIDAVDAIGTQIGAQVESLLKEGCLPGDGASDSCNDWYQNASEEVLADPPEAVVMTLTRSETASEEYMAEGKIEVAQRFLDAGINVIALRDNPRFEDSVPNCVELQGADACARSSEGIYMPSDQLELPDSDHLFFVDYSDRLCNAEVCPVVIDNILVYIDANHLSPAWTLANSDRLELAILRALVTSH